MRIILTIVLAAFGSFCVAAVLLRAYNGNEFNWTYFTLGIFCLWMSYAVWVEKRL